MPRGLGRALQKAVAREGLDQDLEGQGSSLANARRRQVFRYLCLRPCARVSDIGRNLSISQATARWHTWDLIEHGFVQAEGPRVFPSGLIDPDDAALFSMLATAGRATILAATFESPGISFQELSRRAHLTRQSASKIASELVQFGLVTLAEDGRYRRAYPTNLLAQKREANQGRANAFAEGLVRRLADEGLSPELLRRSERTLLVRFGAGARRVLLEVPLDPYATAWIGAG
jgi:DNA-binding transcriptional ArsR family regulator